MERVTREELEELWTAVSVCWQVLGVSSQTIDAASQRGAKWVKTTRRETRRILGREEDKS